MRWLRDSPQQSGDDSDLSLGMLMAGDNDSDEH
jgi:hypothetical protein